MPFLFIDIAIVSLDKPNVKIVFKRVFYLLIYKFHSISDISQVYTHNEHINFYVRLFESDLNLMRV